MSDDSAGRDVPPVLGLVLSGGHSRRFGRDKAGIEIDGQVLLARIFALIDSLCEETFVSVRADQVDEALRKKYRLIVDEQPEFGPASGILAAQAHRPGAAWLVVACDMPFLDEELIRLLIESRQAGKAGISYSSPVDGLPEPLCAIWEPATLEKFRHRVESGGSLSPRHMLVDEKVAIIAAADARTLENINTLADFDRLRLGETAGNE